jgi:hypothetical protein
MGHFSVKISAPSGSILGGTQHGRYSMPISGHVHHQRGRDLRSAPRHAEGRRAIRFDYYADSARVCLHKS